MVFWRESNYFKAFSAHFVHFSLVWNYPQEYGNRTFLICYNYKRGRTHKIIKKSG